MRKVVGIFLALAVVGYVGFSGRFVEFLVPEESPEVLQPVVLSHPIDYSAVVCQSGDGKLPRCRFYMERK